MSVPTKGGRAPSRSLFNVLFIGAGGIVFGNDWVTWNHSQHLERLLGARPRVVGIVDPSRERFAWVMEQKRASPAWGSYTETKQYGTVKEAEEALLPERPPHLILLASPPSLRGTTLPGRDLESQLVASFGSPTMPVKPAVFAEKPVTTGPIDDAYVVAARLRDAGLLVGVGYMLRYLKVVQKAKQILRDRKLVVMSINARYAMAYARVTKADWFDKSLEGGPIVEQATHFCDLCRYLGEEDVGDSTNNADSRNGKGFAKKKNEVVLDSVRAIALEHNEPAGRLCHFSKAIDEAAVQPEQRIPRVTSAFWKYENGAIGTLTHIVALHGIAYENEIDVVADGHQLRLVDLYREPRLFVRYPDDDKEVEYYYPGDDPFYNELEAICTAQERNMGVAEEASLDTSAPKQAKENGNSTAKHEDDDDDDDAKGRILSSFEDATKSYEFSWKIRLESERK